MKLFGRFIVRNHFENTPKNLILLTKYHYRALAAFMTIAMRHAENQRNNVTKNSMTIWKLSVWQSCARGQSDGVLKRSWPWIQLKRATMMDRRNAQNWKIILLRLKPKISTKLQQFAIAKNSTNLCSNFYFMNTRGPTNVRKSIVSDIFRTFKYPAI